MTYQLRDAGSLTGTFVMNEVLADKERRTIHEGDIVTLGATTFILHEANHGEQQ